MGFRFYLPYGNLILGFVPASGHRNTEDGDDGCDDDVGDDARWCGDTDGGTEGEDDGDDGEGGVVGDDADRVTMVQRHGESKTRSTGSVCYLPAHTSCLLVEPPLLF